MISEVVKLTLVLDAGLVPVAEDVLVETRVVLRLASAASLGATTVPAAMAFTVAALLALESAAAGLEARASGFDASLSLYLAATIAELDHFSLCL